MSEDNRVRFTDAEALAYHAEKPAGKLETTPTKPMATQRDLSLAYSPGVAVPVQAIADNPDSAYDYTSKGNLVAVISNGTAILGLGRLGALASKPVMEGKAVLFKRFADVDAIDLEVATEDPQRFIDAVAVLEPSFGGINLEDIAAPDCFIIEQALKEKMEIPVFHDDQHGTAIIAAAGLINACYITKRDLAEIKVVVNGAGAAAIACTELMKSMGVAHENVTMCDRSGVIYQGREGKLDQWKSAHAIRTGARTLADALEGADVFLGLSAAGVLKPKMVENMAKAPIIFAMANPDPEISPTDARAVRPDAIIATGRSDYPNQVNNVLCFPFLFRGALDVRAKTINAEMKIAAAHAIADLARQRVSDEVAAAYGGRMPSFGPDYIIPSPFDPRLMEVVPMAVAQAAIESKVARIKIANIDSYRTRLRARLNPTNLTLTRAYEAARANPRRIIFAEAKEEIVLRAAIQFRDDGYGIPILIGDYEKTRSRLQKLGTADPDSIEIHDSSQSPHSASMVDFLYQRLQRRGYMRSDIERMVARDPDTYAATLLRLGLADGLVTGWTRPYSNALRAVKRVINEAANKTPHGVHIYAARQHTIFMADTTVNERPTAPQLVDIAKSTALVARQMGHEPRVAFISFSTFGSPEGQWLNSMREAVAILDQDPPNFEYEGEIPPNIALSMEAMRNYPFCRLSAPANVLIMPGLQSGNISAKLLRELGGGSVIGPMLVNMEHPVQIIPMAAPVADIVALAVLAAGGIGR